MPDKVELHFMGTPMGFFENTDVCTFLQKFDDESINLILTDLPYCISRETGFANKGLEHLHVSMDFGPWDKMEEKEHIELLEKVFKDCYRILKRGGVIISFYDLWKVETLASILRKNGFKMLRFIEWLKTNPVP